MRGFAVYPVVLFAMTCALVGAGARPAVDLPATFARTATTQGCDIPDADRPLDDAETELLTRINDYRAEFGLPPLVAGPALTRAARLKAASLAAADEAAMAGIRHDDPEESWQQRFWSCGYPEWALMGENIAAGEKRPAVVLELWKQSPAHDDNLRNPAWVSIGIARAVAGTGITFWVVTFGSEPE